MRGLRNRGNGKVTLVEDLPRPEPGEGQVLVKVSASAICGSELPTVQGDEPADGNVGHECMGVVKEPGGSRLPAGRRVGVFIIQGCGSCRWCARGMPDFCGDVSHLRNGHAELVVSRERWLVPLPDDLSDVEGLLVSGDGLGVPWGAAVRGGVRAGHTTCVLGCGPVGLGSLLVHRYLGARVIAADINPARLELAEQMGAWRTVNPREYPLAEAMRDFSDGAGPEVTVEACGRQSTLDAAVEATRPGGTVVLCGHGSQSLDPQKLIFGRNLRLVGNWVCHFCEIPDMISAVRRGLDIARLVTAALPIEEAQTAYDRFIEGREAKVVLTWD